MGSKFSFRHIFLKKADKKSELEQNWTNVVLYKNWFTIYSLEKKSFFIRKLMISSNLIYHTSLNHMQTYHTNGFLHQDKIIKNTAHIAQTKMAVGFFF